MKLNSKSKKLPRTFYTRNVLVVAKDLIGKILVKKHTDGSVIAGKIVEVEAYDGEYDQAAHTYIGRTKRNEIMFGEGGYLYVYFTYGAHFCSNVVTGIEGKGTAVLIRAVEPLEGLDKMAVNRYGRALMNEKEKYNLTSGPGKVCQAFSISAVDYGKDLTGDEIYLLKNESIKPEDIGVSRRIGITKSVDLQWRFFLKNNPYISRK